jgi:hypothetical protein
MADTRLVATPLASSASPAPARLSQAPWRTRHPAQLSDHDGLDWDGLAPPFAWRFELDGQCNCTPGAASA